MMAYFLKGFDSIVGNAGFDIDIFVFHVPDSGCINSLLQVHLEVNEVYQELNMSLGLHIPAHYTETH